MPIETRILAIGVSLVLLLVVLELVRRRRLKEEYALLWLVTAVTLLVLAAWDGLLAAITSAIGAVLASSTLFFAGLVFALLMLLHFSVRVSTLERRMTAVIQEIGINRVQDDDADGATRALAPPSDRPPPGSA